MLSRYTITGLLISMFTGMLLCAAFLLSGYSFLAWIGLFPLLTAQMIQRPKYSFFFWLISGIIFYIGVFGWIAQVGKFRLPYHAILLLYFGAYFGIFGLLLGFIAKKLSNTMALFSAPFLWVVLEYVRANMSFLGLPLGLMAHSQYENRLVIQIASVTGAYGVSFIIVMVNSAFAGIALYALSSIRNKTLAFLTISRLGLITLVGITFILTTLTLFYGQMTVSRPLTGEEVKVAVVQGNIEQTKKWDRRYAGSIMNTYTSLTHEVSKEIPALIIWPETATPGAINQRPRLYRRISHIASETGAYILLGSSQHQKFRKQNPKKLKYFNSAFLISPEETARKKRYDKIRLLPFGEYLPLERTIPWSWIKVPDVGSYTPGKAYTLFEIPALQFGVTICWESAFPELVR